jgi:2-dehydropantoate 2-reductase
VRYIIYGAGAVGGVIGGRLFEHGHDVVLVARGHHYEVLADRGLQWLSPESVVTLPVPVVDHPSRIRFQPDDVVMLTMKTQDTAAALDALGTAAPPDLPIICVQNGVDNERQALRRFPRVYGICVILPAFHLEPGVVRAGAAPVTGILDIGCYPEGTDGVAAEVAAGLQRSTFRSQPEPRIMRRKYTKLLMNLSNAIDAAVEPDSGGDDLRRQARAEAVACFAAAGIDYSSDEEDRQRRQDMSPMWPVPGQPRNASSSWQSLARGTGTIEADYLNGEIVLLGRLYGVPTPVNVLLQQVANRMAREGLPPGSMTVADLEAQLGRT